MTPTVATDRRVIVEAVRPSVDAGAFPAKGAVGQALEVSADVFADGHDLVRAWFQATGPAGKPLEQAMSGGLNDRWKGTFTPTEQGEWTFTVFGIVDDYGTWLRDLRLKLEAGQVVDVELEEGAALVRTREAQAASAADRTAVQKLVAALAQKSTAASRLAAAEKPAAVELVRRLAPREKATSSGPWRVWVDRERAGFSAWYEMFPRSEGATAHRSGTLKAAAKRLPAIAAMGFDVVYIPPVHPIGTTFRKGPNNTLDAGLEDPGSPWAIGGADGGHDALHPDLGTLKDWDAFVAAARREGMEVALDYALQCSPDHPWVRQHPQWFKHRPDGSIKYAENPPKRYQDIYPINFESEDRDNLWRALRDLALFWIGHGVRIFRVDNPHTKPLLFWDWLIAEVKREHPDVLFLAEAFTRPKVMRRLAKGGFTQSYTYFTWRNTKQELTEYLTELSQGDMADFFRPNFWVNTPDILHAALVEGGEPAFRMRAVLAALTCPNWGMYSGYELFENVPVRAGSEEYMDSEKYQYRPRDWNSTRTMAPFITALNGVRRQYPGAFGLLRTLRVHPVDNEGLLCVSRRDDAAREVILVIVNLDPYNAREGTTWLDMDELGLEDDAPFRVEDLLGGDSYTWQGRSNYVRLDPRDRPAHVFRVTGTTR
jgi:starch synthase (maltosyl-transferring)